MKKAFALLLLVSTFVLVNADVIFAGRTLAVFRDHDEAWYGIVAERLQTLSCTGVPVTYLFADRPNFHSCEFLKTVSTAAPGSDIISKTIWMKVLTRAVTLGLFALLGAALLSSAPLGYLIGLVYFVDDGIPILKPLIWPLKSLLKGELDSFTRASRFISPMQYAPVLFAFTFVYLIWIQRLFLGRTTKRPRENLIFFGLAVVAGAAVAFTPFYAWVVHLFFVGSLLAVFTFKRPPRELMLPWLGWFLTFAYSLYRGIRASDIPFKSETLVRSGFFDQQFTPLFVGDKSLILALMAFIVLYWKWLRGYAVLLAIGCYLFVNINVFTGREYQNFHFRDYLGILILLTLFWGSWVRFEKRRVILSGALIISFGLGATQYIRSQLQMPSQLASELSLPDLSLITSFFKAKPPGTRVVCGAFYEALPLTTPAVCSMHHLLMTYPLSNVELMNMHMANFRIQGFSNERVRAHISLDALPTRSLGVWSYGVNSEWTRGKSQTEMYGVENLNSKIIPLWMNEYQNFDQAKARSVLQDAEFMVLENSSADSIITSLTLVKKYSVYGIYTWKN